MNSEKKSSANFIDAAARTAGIAMAILIYGSIVMTVARFEANSAFIDMPLICYLIPGLFGCVFGMGAGMGLAYGMSLLAMPDEIAWLAIALAALYFTLFHAGCLAMLIALISGPLFMALACFPLFLRAGILDHRPLAVAPPGRAGNKIKKSECNLIIEPSLIKIAGILSG